MVCCKCGKESTKGSLKAPFCKECYAKSFKNDKEYIEYLKRK